MKAKDYEQEKSGREQMGYGYGSKKKEKKQKEINLFDTEAILWQLQGWGEYISCGNHVGNTV